MEQVLFFYEAIDRNAIVVIPQKLYFDWANNVFDDNQQLTEHENNIYLINEKDSNEEILEWLKRNFDKFFANELNSWCTDRNKWPQNRNYKMFREWFDTDICSMVLDLEDEPVTKF